MADPARPPASQRPIAPHRVYPDFLPSEVHAGMLDFAVANQDRFEASLLAGQRHDPERRRSRSLHGLAPYGPVLRRRIKELLPALIADLNTPAFELARLQLEMVAHGDGDRFTRHIDTYVGQHRQGADRMLSGVYYFHREPRRFGGGMLRMHAFGPESPDAPYVDVEPRSNALVTFPSWAPHEVTPVTLTSSDFVDSRFAVNCWLYRDGAAEEAGDLDPGRNG